MTHASESRDDSTATVRHCARCGAELPANPTMCWLCREPVATTADKAELSAPAPVTETGSGFSLASLMMFVTLSCVLLGTITIAPGLGVPLAIVAFFTWLRTVRVVRIKGARGAELTAGEKSLLFARSFMSTVALFGMLAVAACAALVTAMYVSCAVDPSPKQEEYITYAVLTAGVTIAALFAFYKLIRYKWRSWKRDMSETEHDRAEK